MQLYVKVLVKKSLEEAVNILKTNPTEKNKKYFEKTYGVSADTYLTVSGYEDMNPSDFLNESQ